jgi:transposase InsO family protein
VRATYFISVLEKRDRDAAAPNVLWVADASYISTSEEFLYLAVVLDVFSRRAVGWAMSDHERQTRSSTVRCQLSQSSWGALPSVRWLLRHFHFDTSMAFRSGASLHYA